MCHQIRLTAFLFLIGLNLSAHLVECIARATVCKDITSKSVELRLKTHLFCDYDSEVRPVIGLKNITTVSLMYMPRFIVFDDDTNIFEMHSWSIVNWTDPHLTWNPEDFDGVSTLQVQSDELWVPDITVHNTNDASEDQSGMPNTYCGLSSDGQILCVPAVKYSAQCQPDFTEYPYDVQVCTIELASWGYHSDEVFLIMSHKPVLSDLYPDAEWEVLYANSFVLTDEFKMNSSLSTRIYTLIFILQRQAANMHVVYVIPAIVLSVMTLSALWLDCHSTERMIVSSISFICHLLMIQHVYWNIPHNGANSPNLLRFYEASFLMMAFVMILTVLLRELRALKSPAPQWLTSATSFVLQSKAGQLLLLSILDPKASAFLEMSADDNDDLVHADKTSSDESKEPNNSTWSYVTLLIGWLAFISVFFAYVVMLAVYLPYKSSYDASMFKK